MISVSEDGDVPVTIDDSNKNCPFGGILREGINDTAPPCLLFCLKGDIKFNSQNYSNCSLATPSTIKWCCESHLNQST